MSATLRLLRPCGRAALNRLVATSRPTAAVAGTSHCPQIASTPAVEAGRFSAASIGQQRFLSTTARLRFADAAPADATSTTTTTSTGAAPAERHEFQAETRMLLDIVARSLYSENEVFIRELVSNASDALEKFRYQLHTGANAGGDGSSSSASSDAVFTEAADRALEIRITTDKQAQQLTIQDTGIGMTRAELIANLGTIARSGSKQFLKQLRASGAAAAEQSETIIGQFGVGFYSAFMVADRLEVRTRSARSGEPGLRWTSDGSGSYEIAEAGDVEIGTQIVVHLKPECREFAGEEKVLEIIRKYSNFVGSPILVNGKRANDIQPLWLLEPRQVDAGQHIQFYRFITASYDSPRFTLHYKTDVPLSIRALLYFPEGKPGMFELSRATDAGVALYTRKVLIQARTDQLLPKWLRFVRGVVDSEDIPLNLSRELLQNSALIRKLRDVLTTRCIRYLQERAQKEPEQYAQFYTEYGLFLKEGIVTSESQAEKEDIGRLLRFDSSRAAADTEQRVSLAEYCEQMGAEQKDIYYIAAPSRALAESSPYYEGLKQKGVEVLFCYEPYDELVLMQLARYGERAITSVEKEMREDRAADNLEGLGAEALQREQIDELLPWLRERLADKASVVKATARLVEHPCVVTVEDMGAARHFVRTQGHQIAEENRYALLQPQLEINPKHQIIRKLFELKTSNPELAELLAKQLFANAMVGAGLSDDPRTLLTTMNELLSRALEKH